MHNISSWLLGEQTIRVVLTNEREALLSFLRNEGVKEVVAVATAAELTGEQPLVLGTAFESRALVIINCGSNDIYAIGEVLFHELGHVFAHSCGFKRTELAANVMAALIPMEQQRKFHAWLRDELGHRTLQGQRGTNLVDVDRRDVLPALEAK